MRLETCSPRPLPTVAVPRQRWAGEFFQVCSCRAGGPRAHCRHSCLNAANGSTRDARRAMTLAARATATVVLSTRLTVFQSSAGSDGIFPTSPEKLGTVPVPPWRTLQRAAANFSSPSPSVKSDGLSSKSGNPGLARVSLRGHPQPVPIFDLAPNLSRRKIAVCPHFHRSL